MFTRLMEAMGKPELAAPDQLGPTAARLARREEVNALVTDWVGGLEFDELMVLCDRYGVPCGPIMNIADIFEDPQYKARGNMQTLHDPRVGDIVLPAGMPRLSETPPTLRHAGRALGADTDQVLRSLLGVSIDDLEAWRAAGVI